MGICNSCEATAVIKTSTTKLIMQDGKMQEFSRPIKVSQVLQKQASSFFICNADDMEFNSFVSAVDDNEELQLGQLYFVLPVAMSKRPLQADDMAKLAVKASAALVASAASFSCDNSRTVKSEFVFSATVQRTRRRGGNKKRMKFEAELSVIPE